MMSNQYTNEVTPQLLAEINKSPFSPQQLAAMDDKAKAIVNEQLAYHCQHPITAIWRIATQDSRTRRGGVISKVDHDWKIRLDSGVYVSVALTGDLITYDDGTTARIISGAGQAGIYKKHELALVGSLLDNGDEIISTPQQHLYIVQRAGVPEAEEFLPVREV